MKLVVEECHIYSTPNMGEGRKLLQGNEELEAWQAARVHKCRNSRNQAKKAIRSAGNYFSKMGRQQAILVLENIAITRYHTTRTTSKFSARILDPKIIQEW